MKEVGNMMEIPEALTIARQVADTCGGRVIRQVRADASPHKFA